MKRNASPSQFTFNGFLKAEFQGSRVTSGAGLVLVRELDEQLGLATFIAWSLTSLQQRLVKTGGRLVKHSRYYWLLLARAT